MVKRDEGYGRCGLETVLPQAGDESTAGESNHDNVQLPNTRYVRAWRRWELLASKAKKRESLLRWDVPSEKNPMESHVVDLGDNECSCDGFGRHRTPCKHIMAARAALGEMVAKHILND